MCIRDSTQTELEIRRVLFGIDPDDQILPKHQGRQTRRWIPAEKSPAGEEPKLHTMDIDFQALMERDREDPELSAMHSYFSKVKPTAENGWTGRFQGKNLVWIVAEGFSDRMLDPVRTPTLWKLAHEGIICDNFYTPLWGAVSYTHLDVYKRQVCGSWPWSFCRWAGRQRWAPTPSPSICWETPGHSWGWYCWSPARP